MEENAPPSPSHFLGITGRLSDSRTVMAIAVAVALAIAGAAAGWRLYLVPIRATTQARYQSHQCLMRLYDLQMAYHGAHGTYANDLDTLLTGVPDAAQLREKLKASVDLNTLAVVGDANRFRLEINILDPERTPVKIRGPLGRH